MMRVRIVDNTPRVRVRLHVGVDQEVERSAIAIEQDVKGGPHAAPYRTGNLRRSYRHRRIGPLHYVVENDPAIAPYAAFVELGTDRMAPRPHLLPAALAEADRLVSRLTHALR